MLQSFSLLVCGLSAAWAQHSVAVAPVSNLGTRFQGVASIGSQDKGAPVVMTPILPWLNLGANVLNVTIPGVKPQNVGITAAAVVPAASVQPSVKAVPVSDLGTGFQGVSGNGLQNKAAAGVHDFATKAVESVTGELGQDLVRTHGDLEATQEVLDHAYSERRAGQDGLPDSPIVANNAGLRLPAKLYPRVEVVTVPKGLSVLVMKSRPQTLLLGGRVAGPDSILRLTLDGEPIDVAVEEGAGIAEVFAAIERSLPDEFEMVVVLEHVVRGVYVDIRRKTVSEFPAVVPVSTDFQQKTEALTQNSFKITGVASQSLPENINRAVIKIDGVKFEVPIQKGDPPLMTARRILGALPKEYEGTIVGTGDGPDSPVVVTIARRAKK